MTTPSSTTPSGIRIRPPAPESHETQRGMWLIMSLFVVFVASMIGLVVYMTVTHQTGYDDRQREVHKCEHRGLTAVEDYAGDIKCVNAGKP